jgi:hypothetical protein
MKDGPALFLVYTDSLTRRTRLDYTLRSLGANTFQDRDSFSAALGNRERAVAFVVGRLSRDHLTRLTRFRVERRHLPAVLVMEAAPENVKAVNRLPTFEEVPPGRASDAARRSRPTGKALEAVRGGATNRIDGAPRAGAPGDACKCVSAEATGAHRPRARKHPRRDAAAALGDVASIRATRNEVARFRGLVVGRPRHGNWCARGTAEQDGGPPRRGQVHALCCTSQEYR